MNEPATDSSGLPQNGDAGPVSVAPDIGWLRAIVAGTAIVLVGFFGAVFLPNLVVQNDAMSSSIRSLLALAIMLTVVIATAWALRRLQARRLI